MNGNLYKNSGELSPRNFFSGEYHAADDNENAGFGITSASGYGLKAIYTRWYIQNHLSLITEEEKAAFLSNDIIHQFLEANPSIQESENDSDEPQAVSRATPDKISMFKERLADNEKLRKDYLSLCKSIKLGSDIPYNDELIGQFSEFMGLNGLVAARNISNTSHTLVIDDSIIKELLDGNVQPGIHLRRYMSIKILQNFTVGIGEGTMKVQKNKYDHTIEVDKRALPSLNPIADTLWQARIDKGLFQNVAAQLSGVSQQNISEYENGRKFHPKAPFLHKLLGLYDRADLHNDENFMRAVISINKATNPFGHQLELERYKLGLKKEDFAKKIGVADIYRYVMGIGLPNPETFKKICDELGRSSFLNNPAIMQQVVAIDKERYPFSYQLRFNRYKNGLNMPMLEDATGVKSAAIGYQENNVSTMDPGHFKKISDFLGPSDFLGNPAVMQQIVGIDKAKNPFGYQLKYNRYKKGLNALEAAGAMTMSASPINQYEDGSRLPSQGTFKKICDFFGPSDFLDNTAVMQQIVEIDRKKQPFSYQLRYQMYKNGMNPQTLAGKIEKRIQSVLDYEAGTKPPDMETLEKICSELKWDFKEAKELQRIQQEKNLAKTHQQSKKPRKQDTPRTK